MAFRTKLFLNLLVTVGVLFLLNQRSAAKISFRLIQEKVLAIAVSAAPLVDGDVHETLTLAGQNNSDSVTMSQMSDRSLLLGKSTNQSSSQRPLRSSSDGSLLTSVGGHAYLNRNSRKRCIKFVGDGEKSLKDQPFH